MKAEPGVLTPAFRPWSQWVPEVAASKVALVTTAGAYLKHGLHEPFDLGRAGGDPSFREFPSVVDLADVALAGVAQGPAGDGARAGGEPDQSGHGVRTGGSEPDRSGTGVRTGGSEPDQHGGAGQTSGSEPDRSGTGVRTGGSEPDQHGDEGQASADAQDGADREAREHVNRVFPLDRLRSMAAAGDIDAVAPFAYSFSGAVSDLLPLLADSGPAVAYRIRRMGADVVLVVAAGESGVQTAAIVARLVELAGIPTVVLAADAGALRAAGVPRGVAMDPAEWLQRLPEALEAAWSLNAPAVVEL